MVSFTTTITSLCALAASVSALNSIVVNEQEFVDSVTNERFMIIGVDYQPGGQASFGPTNTEDPLSNGTACLRDAALMQQLGVNTIRSYNVDATLNHDECASIFNSAGIYMLIDVNSPLAGQSLDRSDPSSSYDIGYLQHIFTVVEAFKSYPNTLGFFAGNEIINDIPTGQANPPYIRAVQRDLKQYIAAHAPRTIPVGYSAADVAEVLGDTWAYLQCNNNDNETSRSDFFGLNDYSWCGPTATFESSGYNTLVATFSNTTIPVFFSEYGCNQPAPRYFNEVQALYGPQMTVLSGGLVYEWDEESNDFGLVNVYSNGTAQLLGDYDRLQGQYNKINVTLLESSNSTAASLQPPACNADLITTSGFSTDFNIPAQPDGAAALISSGISSAPTGSIISVTATSVGLAVYNTAGAQIDNLSIKPVANNAQNVPTGADTGASATGSAAAGTATGSGASSGSTATASGSGAASSASATGGAARSFDKAGTAALVAAVGAGLLAVAL